MLLDVFAIARKNLFERARRVMDIKKEA